MQYRELDRWMAKSELDELCIQRSDSVVAMQEAGRCGVGLTVLPLYLAEKDTGLQRLTEPVEDLSIDLWVLVHQDLRTVGRIKLFTNKISKMIAEELARYSV